MDFALPTDALEFFRSPSLYTQVTSRFSQLEILFYIAWLFSWCQVYRL